MVSGSMTVLTAAGAPTPEMIKTLDARVRKLFTYVHDKHGADLWTSYASNVKLNKPFYGDCDDLASTTLDMISQLGYPKTCMARGLVSSKKNSLVDHMIAYCMDNLGKVWVVGDTFGPAYPISRMQHQQLEYSPVTTGISWSKGKIPGT